MLNTAQSGGDGDIAEVDLANESDKGVESVTWAVVYFGNNALALIISKLTAILPDTLKVSVSGLEKVGTLELLVCLPLACVIHNSLVVGCFNA